MWKEGNTLYPGHRLKGGVAKTMAMVEETELVGDFEPEGDTGVLVMPVLDETDPEYVIRYAQAVKLFSEHTRRCFACGSEEHLVRDCPSRAAKTVKANLNSKEGRVEKGTCPSVRKMNVLLGHKPMGTKA